MEQLKNFNFSDLQEKLRLTDNDFDAWLENIGLLHGKRTCRKCGGRTSNKVDKGRRYRSWRCTTKKCRAEQGYLCGTFFEGTHLTTKQIFHLSYFWAYQFGDSYNVLESKTGISHPTITKWLNLFRGMCTTYFIKNPLQVEDVNEGNNCKTNNQTYSPEYLWRKQFGDISNVFFNFWYHISLLYPCER